MAPPNELGVDLFISYRRHDTVQQAADLYLELGARYGAERVFRDAERESIQGGEPFGESITTALNSCQVLLALIGPGWLVRERVAWYLPRRRRIDQPDDWVRREISEARKRRCHIIPVLVNGAQMPTRNNFPKDLKFLPDLHAMAIDFRDAQARVAGLDRLVSRLKVLCPPPPNLPTSSADLLDRGTGAPWNPREPLNPHEFDYKLCIEDEQERRSLRRRIFYAAVSHDEPGPAITMAELKRVGRFRKYRDSEKKHGLFLQASCLLTAGGHFDAPEQLLVVTRSEDQAHATGISRNLAGASCLISTPLADFAILDEFGHCPVILFNDAVASQPLALFSRKLLIPFPKAVSRFAGLGYNLEKEGKEYLFFVWHVHLPEAVEVMITRDSHKPKKKRDQPCWVRISALEHGAFGKAMVDQAAAEAVFQKSLGPEDAMAGLTPWGFLADFPFERVPDHRGPVEVKTQHPFHLLGAAFQQAIHQNSKAAPSSLVELENSFIEFATSWKSRFALKLLPRIESAEEFGLPNGRLIRIFSDLPNITQTGIFILLFECDSSHPVNPISRSANTTPEDVPVVILRGLPSRFEDRYELQGTRGTSTAFREYLIAGKDESEVVLQAVSHAVFVFSSQSAKPEDVLLLRSEDPTDQRWKLPGGKVEEGETTEAALYRELEEELSLTKNHISRVQSLSDDQDEDETGFTDIAISPRTKLRTRYHFHPFLIHLTEEGRHLLWGRVNQANSCFLPMSLETWEKTGLGYSKAYPRKICEAIRRVWRLRSAEFD